MTEERRERKKVYQRNWRKKNHLRERLKEKSKNIEAWRARKTFCNAVRDGKIKRQPCSICGKPNAHGHHEDYSKPLEVIWFCQAHHNQYHRGLVKLP